MTTDSPPSHDGAELILKHLQGILQSPQFSASERLREFLAFVVREALEGRSAELKEHTIAVAVYRRPVDFDPKLDSIVRTEARRLRLRLKEYYAGSGADDAVRIDLPLGRYVPQFTVPSQDIIADSPQPPSGPPPELDVVVPVADARRTVSRRALMATLSVAGLAVVFRLRPQQAPAPRRVGVLIVPFTYAAGSGIPEHSLESAIEFALAESRSVIVIPRIRVEDVLALLKLPRDTAVTPALAREVSARDSGIDVVLTGEVAWKVSGWVVSVWLRESTGRAIAATFRTIPSEEAAVTTATALGTWLRTSVRDVDMNRQSLPLVATRSLAALRLYSEGITAWDRQNLVAAESLFSDAASQDPTFASAHIYHAWALRALARPTSAVLAAAREAEAFAVEASESERLFIRASARQLEGKIEEAASLYTGLLELYPDHRWALANLTGYASGMQAAPLVEYWQRYADLRPNDARTALSAATWFTLNARTPSTAARYLRRARTLTEAPDAHCVMDWLAAFQPWVQGDEKPWLDAAGRAAVVPVTSRYSVPLALLLIGAGRPLAGQAVLRLGGDPVGIQRWSAIAALTRRDGAALEGAAGSLVGTRPNALSAMVLAWSGRHEAARRMALERRHSIVSGASAPDIDAFWVVAEAERRWAVNPAEDLGAALEQARTRLEGTRYVEYFVASYRIAERALVSGDASTARRILRAAVGQRAAAYPEAMVFWVACLERLARLEPEHRPTGPGGARWADVLRRTLTVREPDFHPAALYQRPASLRS